MKIQSMTIIYEQPSDLSDDTQTIKISTADNGAGKYFVIKTDRWAIDKPEELVKLIKDFQSKL